MSYAPSDSCVMSVNEMTDTLRPATSRRTSVGLGHLRHGYQDVVSDPGLSSTDSDQQWRHLPGFPITRSRRDPYCPTHRRRRAAPAARARIDPEWGPPRVSVR